MTFKYAMVSTVRSSPGTIDRKALLFDRDLLFRCLFFRNSKVDRDAFGSRPCVKHAGQPWDTEVYRGETTVHQDAFVVDLEYPV